MRVKIAQLRKLFNKIRNSEFDFETEYTGLRLRQEMDQTEFYYRRDANFYKLRLHQ